MLNKTFRLMILGMILLFSGVLFAQSNLIIHGENQAKFIYKAAEDSLKNYFTDEFGFSVNYNEFTFGMSFLSYLPKYDQYQSIDELNPSDIDWAWDERYLQWKSDPFMIQGGTFEEVFGNGVVLRSWNDKDMDRDKRLDGFLFRYNPGNLGFKALYGAVRKTISEEQLLKKDLVLGLDSEYQLFDYVKLGSSVLQYKSQNPLTSYSDYTHKNIYSFRSSLNQDKYDLNTEYAEIRYEHNVPENYRGHAFFATSNIFIDRFTFSTGYKKYHQFKNSLADLPALNHYDQLLANEASVKDEEGAMGEVKFIPNTEHEMTLHYSESWNENFKVRFSNFFADYKYSMESMSILAEFEQIETVNEYAVTWVKESHPTITLDFYQLAMPLTIKTKWKFVNKSHEDNNHYLQEPYLQCDVKLHDKLAVSLIGEYEFEGWDNFGKNSAWIGGELKTSISTHTELKLFAGKEKGGKVCRNGVCKYQSAFDGLRLELTTSF